MLTSDKCLNIIWKVTFYKVRFLLVSMINGLVCCLRKINSFIFLIILLCPHIMRWFPTHHCDHLVYFHYILTKEKQSRKVTMTRTCKEQCEHCLQHLCNLCLSVYNQETPDQLQHLPGGEISQYNNKTTELLAKYTQITVYSALRQKAYPVLHLLQW